MWDEIYEYGRAAVGLLDLASPPQGWGEPASYPPNVIIIIITIIIIYIIIIVIIISHHLHHQDDQIKI